MADHTTIVSKVEKMKTIYSTDKPKKKKSKENAAVNNSSKIVNDTDEEFIDNFSDTTLSANSKWHSKSLYMPDSAPLNSDDELSAFSVHSEHYTESKKTNNKKSSKPKKPRQVETEFQEQSQPGSHQSKLRAKINSASSLRLPSREVKLPFSLRDTPIGKYRNTNPLPQLGSPGYSANANLSDSNNTGFSVDVDQMKRKITELERSNEKLNYQLEQKDIDYVKAEHQIHKLLLDLDKSKRQSEEMIEHLHDRHRTQLLNLKEEHSKEMAVLSVISVKNAVSNLDPSSKAFNSMTIEEAVEVIKRLTEQVETQQKKQHKLLDDFNDEKKMIIADYNKRLLAAEKEAKAEILNIRAKIITNEDVISTQKEDLAKALSKLDATTKLNRQLEKTRDDLTENLNKTNNEVKSLQQSLSSNFRFEGASNFNATAGAGATSSGTNGNTFSFDGRQNFGTSNNFGGNSTISEAKNDSKVKQMTNKIEFLKSQLETEQSSVEDLKNALNATQTKLNELRYEYRLKMQEVEQGKKAAVEEAEQRLEEVYEERMVQLTTLQSKIGFYEQQLNEARHENVLAKQREEGLKATVLKTQAQNSAYKMEIDRNVSQITDLKQEIDRQLSKVENTYQNDAIIRRLDNERQYLKSQVTSEITLKNELQKALIQLQQQLSESHRQWQSDVDTLKNENTAFSQKIIAQDQDHQQALINLEAECSRLNVHSAELKNAYAKMRDQTRVDALMIEDYTSLTRRLDEEISALKQEALAANLSKQREAESHKLKLEEASTLLADTEYELKNEILNLKEELAKQLIAISSTQNESKALHDQHIAKRLEFNQKIGALKILQTFTKMKQNRVATYFRIWCVKTTLNGVAIQFRQNVQSYEKKIINQSDVTKKSALENLQNQLRKEAEDNIVILKKEHEEALFNAKNQYICEKVDLQIELTKKHKEETKQKEEEWNNALVEAETVHKKDLAEITNRLNSEIEALSRKIADQTLLYKEASQKFIEDAKNETENYYIIQLKTQEIELSEAHKAQRAIAEAEALKKFEILLKTAKAKWKKKVTDKEAETAETIEKLNIKNNNELIKLSAQFDEEKKLLEVQHNETTRQLTHQLTLAHEKSIQQLKQSHQEAVDSKIADIKSKYEAQFMTEKLQLLKDEELKRYNDAKLSREDFTKKMTEEKLATAEKEAARWKRILKESEDSYDQIIRSCKDDARMERETALNSQSASLEVQYKQQLDNMLKETKDQLEKMSKMYEKQIAQQTESHEAEKSVITKGVEIQTKDAVDKEWEAKMKKAIEHVQQDFEAVWAKKLISEQESHNQTRSVSSSQMSKLYDELGRLKESMMQMEQEKSDAIKSRQKSIEDSEALKSALILKFAQEKEAIALEHNQKYESALSQLEKAHQDMLQDCVTKIRTDTLNEAEQQIEQLQQQSEIVISGLESSLSRCRQDISQSEQHLKEYSQQLENAEDSLFDLKDTLKNNTRANSIQVWKLLTGAQILKLNSKKVLETVTKQAMSEKSQLTRNHQNAVNKLNNAIIKLAATVQEVEDTKKVALKTLTTHKSDILSEKRSFIKNAHVELDRLDKEFDSLEDQRRDKIDEIDGLQQQVRDLEDQIRTHNSESMIQNGRVNVMHGKKKKRLDEELEKLLESIEQKSLMLKDIEDKLSEVTQLKNAKELTVVDVEKSLVEILIEQQRMVMKLLNESNGSSEEKLKSLLESTGVSWPPPAAASGSLLQEDDEDNEK